MRFFLTGATGLLGNNLARELLQRGHEVVALVRDATKAASLPADVQLLHGDMNDVAAFAPALAKADGVIHTAAYFRDSYKGGRHYEAMARVNVASTSALAQAAYDHGVRRFVHVSSIATVRAPDGVAATEAMRRSAPGEQDDYYRTKILADEALERFAHDHEDFHISFVLPGFMVGPGDLGPTAAGQMVLDFVRQKLPGVAAGGFSFVDARDVAAACARLAESPRPNERFLVAGRYHSLRDTYAALERVSGVRAPQRRLPDWLLKAFAFASEIYARLFRRPVLLSWAGVKTLIRERARGHFDSSKAQRELAVAFRPLEQSLADTLQDYRDRGWLDRRAI